MRSFGMTPVLPAFAGFVPPALARKRPGLNIVRCSPLGSHLLKPWDRTACQPLAR